MLTVLYDSLIYLTMIYSASSTCQNFCWEWTRKHRETKQSSLVAETDQRHLTRQIDL